MGGDIILSATIGAMRLVKTIAILTTSLLLLVGCSVKQEQPFSSQVGLQLFMWPWQSVSSECESLGEQGFDWVLVSPPQEHIVGSAWWTVYQPVSYQLQSRLGDRAEFENMVQVCTDKGVRVLVDVVINHMSAQDSGVGFAGTNFEKYSYPGLYGPEDFHDCQLTAGNSIENYGDAQQVQTCELLGLSDLDQSKPNVQTTIIDYLKDLLGLGVAGFRIDAAKHIAPADLKPIISALPEQTIVLLEVIRGSGEPIQPEQYAELGYMWEFDYARSMRSYFEDQLIGFIDLSTRFDGYLPSDKAISFITNHDTERNSQSLNFNYQREFDLATSLMLAEPYGTPMLYSSYYFFDYDAGPVEENGLVSPVVCPTNPTSDNTYSDRDWICQHRWQSISKMIRFRDLVDKSAVVNTLQTENLFGFERESKGYFIVNVSPDTEESVEVQTTLPDGSYLDLLSEETFEVVNGSLTLKLKSLTAMALVGN